MRNTCCINAAGFGARVWGLGLMVYGYGLEIEGLGCGVEGQRQLPEKAFEGWWI